MKNTKITKDQAIGLMCMESATNMPYRVLNAAGKWAVTEFVSKYAARENIISEWFNKVESIANNCAHDETVIVEMRRTMTKSGNPETFAMNDSHFDWMVQEEGTQEPTLPGQAIILFESMTNEQKGMMTFDPTRTFDSTQEAIDLILTQIDPLAALKAVVDANITFNEFGFVAELVLHYSRLEC